MNLMSSNNNYIVIRGNRVWVDGNEIPLCPSKSNIQCSTISNDNKVFINGYEWTGKKWKRTLRALWNLWF